MNTTGEKWVYKVCPRDAWVAAEARGGYEGSADDARDGFIHLSTWSQLPGTLTKHYAGQDNLVLIAFAPEALGSQLKWEPSRGGALFPHLYGELSPGLAIGIWPLPLDDQGVPQAPVAAQQG